MSKMALLTMRTSRPWHTAVVATLIAGLVLSFGYMSAQFFSANDDDLSFTRDERTGIAYLRPLNKLVGVLAESQSEAVRGKEPDTLRLRNAVSEVSEADRAHGARLGTGQRWTDLREKLDDLGTRKVSGQDAYTAYSENVDLTLALIGRVADTSNLILDPELDTYYLMDAALLRLPALVVDSGRTVDLMRLGSDAPKEEQQAALGRVLTLRDRVAASAAAADTDLRKSFDATTSPTLGPDLLGQVDRLRTLASDLAPTTALLDPPVELSDAEQFAGARERLVSAVLELDSAVLTELDTLLEDRADDLERQRLWGVLVVLAAAAAGLWLLWSRLPRRGAGEGGAPPAREHARHRRHAAAETPDGADGADGAPPGDIRDLVDARDLLYSDELVRMGRAVTPRRRERFDETE